MNGIKKEKTEISTIAQNTFKNLNKSIDNKYSLEEFLSVTKINSALLCIFYVQMTFKCFFIHSPIF